MPRETYVWDSDLKKLVKKSERQHHRGPYVQGDIEPFQSPIDKTWITTRSQLNAHHKQHGTTDMRDYSEDYLASRVKKRMDCLNGKEAKRQRIETIKQAIHFHEEN